MILRQATIGTLVGATTLALSMALAPVASAAPATPSDQDERQVVLHYDDSKAGEFKGTMAAAAAAWNSSVHNVKVKKASPGEHAEITVLAYDGWAQAELGPVKPGGSVKLWIGRDTVNQGHDQLRVTAHELGHSLGLRDNSPGPCSSLMAGGGAGVDCKNPYPDSAERAETEWNYASGVTTPTDGRVLVDAP
ncbi:snapalysin family zinc-dependent metalloprotease [Streptomyces alboflavus]|uniref:snapalysin family zinc-dependent metalloprotease n=1 Tax=Streptomyces alboflavus TaxID=67267 RepID=UPI000A72BC0E